MIAGGASGGSTFFISVFRIGNPTHNISCKSYQDVARNPSIKWTIPISLGDPHHGYRVMGTNASYFEHFRFAGGRQLEISQGRIFEGIFDAVHGADVAQTLNYLLNDPIIIAHGAGKVSFIKHDDKHFYVVGIFKKTGTPVNQYALMHINTAAQTKTFTDKSNSFQRWRLW